MCGVEVEILRRDYQVFLVRRFQNQKPPGSKYAMCFRDKRFQAFEGNVLGDVEAC